MILIGLESCPGCKIIHEAHPEVNFIEVPRKGACSQSKELCEIKKALSNLGITKFPVLLTDDYSEKIPLETIDPKLKGYNED